LATSTTGKSEYDMIGFRGVKNFCRVALHFVYYNLVKQHKILRVTPAMAAGITKRFRSIGENVNLVVEEAPKKRVV
jgi:hypothetical protein